MTQTITVEKKLLENILSQLKEVKSELKSLRKNMRDLAPEYGSKSWWDKETREALKEYETGNYKSYNNADDLMKDLHS